MTTQRRGRSQAGPLDPWGQGRLHEHQPKLKCLFLLPCWLCSCPAPPPVTPACPWRALCTQRGPESPGGHRELRGAASTQHVQTYAPYAHVPTGSGRRAPSGGALRSHPPARGGQFTFVMLCQRTSHPSGSRRPSSLAYRLVLVGGGGEAGRRGGGEPGSRGAQPCDASALGRGHRSPRPFQKGRPLGGQAPTPPEWPSLPAKEQRRHTSTAETPARPRLAWPTERGSEGRWEGVGTRREKGGVSTQERKAGVGSASCQEGSSRPSICLGVQGGARQFCFWLPGAHVACVCWSLPRASSTWPAGPACVSGCPSSPGLAHSLVPARRIATGRDKSSQTTGPPETRASP